MRIISFAAIRNCILKHADSEMALRDCFGSHAFFIQYARLVYSFPLKQKVSGFLFISGSAASGANSPNTEEPEPLMDA